MIAPWHEQRRPRTRSTQWPSPGGGKSWTSLPAGSAPSTTLSASSGWRSHRCPSTFGCSAKWGAVDVRDEGRQRLYRLNGHALKPIHDWVKAYERLWAERFDELDDVLEDLKQKEEDHGSE